MRMLGMLMIIGLIAGVIPAVGHTNAEQGILQTSVSVYVGESETYQLTQGQNVSVKITVKNVGDGAAVLSNCIPPTVYLYVYDANGEMVDKVVKKSEVVMWTLKNLRPGDVYTTTVNWVVPQNLNSGIYTIVGKVGNSPEGSTTVNLVSNTEAALFVAVYTDSVIYYSGEEITIHIVNLADIPVTFGSGFYVVSEDGKVITEKAYRHVVTLQPYEEITYTWNSVDKDGNMVEPGVYYIYSYANENPCAVIIF